MSTCCVSARPSSHGTPPCLIEVSGDAPVPPSCPEISTTSACALDTPAATDITMPVMDGFEALRQIRKVSDVPVLMLTARGDEVDRIVGLEIGADDYLPKPFNPRELVARLRAILRRVQMTSRETGRIAQGPISIEPGSQSLFRNGEPVPVTATEFIIAELLLRSAGTVVSKEELTEKALGRRLTVYDRSLDTHMANLRKKLGAADDGSALIKTVRGQGYIFVRH